MAGVISILYVATAAVFLVAGLEKLTTPEHLVELLRQARLGSLSNTYLIRAVATVELVLGSGLLVFRASSWPQGGVVVAAVAYVVIVTPIGGLLIASTGMCGCHQPMWLETSQTDKIGGLVLRNGLMIGGLIAYSLGHPSELALLISSVLLAAVAAGDALLALRRSLTLKSKLQSRMLEARAKEVYQTSYVKP